MLGRGLFLRICHNFGVIWAFNKRCVVQLWLMILAALVLVLSEW
jgi:hypothetical protein